MAMEDRSQQPARRRGSLDPTRTGLLRKSFRAKAMLNLRSLRADLRHVIVQMDLLGLNTSTNKSVFAFQTPSQRLQQFSGWLETAALANLDANWWIYPFIEKAVTSGLDRANKELPGHHFIPNFTSFDNLHELAKNEVRGIIAALVQKTVRGAHTAMMQSLPPSAAFTHMAQPLDTEFKTRFALLTHFITVKAHAQAKLAVYRSAGIKKIGIEPENHVVHAVKVQTHDDQSENYVVGWGTADDELVCAECDEMAQDSPYTIDDIEDMFPLHPNCRCAPYPWPAADDSGDFD